MDNNINNPLVSVVITTYNRPINILSRAIESVLNQTYKNIEVFLVNACPSNIDLKASIIEYITKLKDIKYIELKQDSLANVARQEGLKNADGEYIAFLDDDDEWIKNKIEIQVNAFNEADVGLVYGPYIEIKGEEKNIVKYANNEGIVIKELLANNFIGGASMPLISTKILREVGGFDVRLPSSQDYDTWIRICEKSKVKYIDKPLVNYYISNDAITRNPKKRIDGWLMLEEKYQNLFYKYKGSYNIFLNNLSRHFYEIDDKKSAKLFLKKAFKIKMFSLRNIKTLIWINR